MYMKKLILLLLLSFSIIANVQSQYQQQPRQYQQQQQQQISRNNSYLTDNQKYHLDVVYIPWTQQYPAVNCMPSFYWSVTRTNMRNDYGQFLYRMYFRSNSSCNGSVRGVYISGIFLYINGQIVNPQSKYWINFSDIYQPPTLTFWSESNPMINFTWDNVIIN